MLARMSIKRMRKSGRGMTKSKSCIPLDTDGLRETGYTLIRLIAQGPRNIGMELSRGKLLDVTAERNLVREQH